MAPTAGPLFRQIARAIGDAIEGGTQAVGSLLPTEQELCRRHGVSRHTVREALGALRAQGLIESRQGVGSVVVRRRAATAYTETYSSIEELIRFAKDAPIQTYRTEEVIADDALAALLRGRPGQSYLRILGVRFGRGDDLPVAHVDVYVDVTYGGIRNLLAGLRRSVAETVESLYGIRIARIEQEIAADLLDDEQARRLQVDSGAPALRIRRWYASDTGRVFEAAFSRYPMDRFVYRNVLVRGVG